MRYLEISHDTFDRKTFTVDIGRKVPRTCKLCHYKDDDGKDVLWIMQLSACLKSHYTAEDHAEQNRLMITPPLKHGDVVMAEVNAVWSAYEVIVKGDYSDLGILRKL